MLLQQKLVSAVLSMLLPPVSVSVRLSGVSTNQQMQMLLRLLSMVQMLPQQLLLSAVLPVLLTAVAVRTAVQMLLLELLSLVPLQMLLRALNVAFEVALDGGSEFASTPPGGQYEHIALNGADVACSASVVAQTGGAPAVALTIWDVLCPQEDDIEDMTVQDALGMMNDR